MLVVDCSVAIKWFVSEQGSDAARSLLPEAQGKKLDIDSLLVAPAFILLEAHYVLAKQFNKGIIQESVLFDALTELRLQLVLDPLTAEVAAKAWAISNEPLSTTPPSSPLGIYDSVYIAMALSFGARLATADIRQAATAKALGVDVVFIGRDADRSA